jgi:hypothetical protein
MKSGSSWNAGTTLTDGTFQRAARWRYTASSALPVDEEASCGNSGNTTTRSTPAASRRSSASGIDGWP